MSDKTEYKAAAGARLRVVFALSAEERELFLAGQEDAVRTLPADVVWASEAELVADGWEARLRAWAPTVLVTGWETPPLPAAWLGEAACPLHYVCHVTGSVRRHVPRTFLEKGGQVTNWGTLAAAPVAEQALLLALAALRNLPGWRSYVDVPPERRSIKELDTRSLFGRRVGLHGFGAIARELVGLLRPFRVEIAAYSTGVPREMMTALGVEPCASLDELFARSDVLFECEALTPQTGAACRRQCSRPCRTAPSS